MSYNRPLSPGGKRLQNPARASDSLADPSYYQRHNSYTSPRGSSDRVGGGVIPISSQTFVSNPPPRDSRQDVRYDSYTGRPRRSSLVDTTRPSAASTSAMPSRVRPNLVQSSDTGRTSSPPTRTNRDPYYVTPAASKPDARKVDHRKVYSIDEGSAKLQSEADIPAGGGRHHKRRDSADRVGYRTGDTGRGRPGYHSNGHPAKREKPIDEEDAYSYTDAAGMFNETEPKWRPRRSSIDRGSRERPLSMYEVVDPRKSDRVLAGPPPSTRGWDRLQDLGRARSVRDPQQRDVPHSPSRGRYEADPRDQYYVRPRANSNDRRTAALAAASAPQNGPVEVLSDYEERREPRQHQRRLSASGTRPERSVERRGFGIRNDSADRFGGRDRSGSIDRYGPRDRSGSIDRYGPTGRGSNESFTKAGASYPARDSGYIDPHRRDTAPEAPRPDERERLERQRAERERQWLAESRDKDYRRQNEERDDQQLAEAREKDRRRESRYEDPHDRGRDRPRYEDRNREYGRMRDRDRSYESDSDRIRERHHQRRNSDRPREHNRRDSQDRGSSFSSSVAPVAATGLAGAAMVGAKKLYDDHKDRRDERDRQPERPQEEKRDRDRDSDRERERERDREREREAERRNRKPDTNSDDAPSFERDQYRRRDPERGLGFAFEEPPQQQVRPPNDPTHDQARDRPMPPREFEQERQPSTVPYPQPYERPPESQTPQVPQASQAPQEQAAPPQGPIEMPQPAIDPDEEFRRRWQQMQSELGQSEDRHSSDVEADRERRRREREQRQRERELRATEYASTVTAGSTDYPAPAHQQQQPIRRSPDHSVAGTYSTTGTSVVGTDDGSERLGLERKRSILDAPMNDESFQIIDNTQSEKRENRVRIVDPPSVQEESRPKGILKKPTQKFPEDPNAVREGVAPLKDATKKGVPPGARWTKIKRELVNPEALEEAKERFEERQDCVIVLRVLSRPEIQKLADRTAELREQRYREEERHASRRRDRERDRRDRDEYEDDSENEFRAKTPKMLEAPSAISSSAPEADFNDRRRERDRERDSEREYVRRDY